MTAGAAGGAAAGGAAYGFRPASAADLPLLRSWIARPHVRAWWGEGDPFDAGDLESPLFAAWIVETGGRPFAYMQDYAVHGFEADHHLGFLPPGARGIDQFIGEPDMTGRGHGTAFIGQRVRAMFGSCVPAVGTDPHPDNARAIKAYRKAGFRAEGPPRETRWGLVQPMAARPG